MTYSTKDDPLRPLETEDLNWIIRSMPATARSMLTHKASGPVFLAGGFIRGTIAREEISDVDIFCPNGAVTDELGATLSQDLWKSGIRTPNAHSIKADGVIIQLVDRWPFETAQEIIAAFDFTICQAVIWLDHNSRTWKSLRSSRFYQDLAAKRLVYTNPGSESAPGGSLLRVIKYARRGYQISLPDLAAIVTATAQVATTADISEADVLEHLFSVDPTENELIAKNLNQTEFEHWPDDSDDPFKEA